MIVAPLTNTKNPRALDKIMKPIFCRIRQLSNVVKF